jgi:hypothetical protein
MARLQCALIGVLISVTTIPVAASVGVAAAYRDWTSFRGSLGQLAVNIAALLAAGTLTLVVQRAIYARRRAAHERAASATRVSSTSRSRSAAGAGAARGSAEDRGRAQPWAPSDAQTSSFVRTRPMTSPVNSVVDAWPPRSGVRTPDAVASRTLS